MRNLLLICLTMSAFAMNSILNRAAVEGGHADPSSFALVRVLAGIVALVMIMSVRGGRLELLNPRRWGGGLALAIYMIGFSLAYLSLDAGVGALILFGTVQISLFTYAALWEVMPTRAQVIGAGVAFAGLLLALWPGEGSTVTLMGGAFMLMAGIGWAAYTLAGRQARDPIAVTTSHFLLSLPFLCVLLVQSGLFISTTGLGLAILSGAATSGLGYALWYSVLPNLPGARAAVVQLSVPVLAIGLGVLLLGEQVGPQILIAATLVLGGIAYALSARPAPADRS